MKAVVYTQYGPPEVLRLKEVEQPAPEDNEVRVRVHAASVNSWDWDLVRGTPFVNRLMFGLRTPRIKILGCDIAGEVETVGKGVNQFQVGDEVFGDISGSGWGGFAEYVCAREDVLARKPAGITFEEAAAIPQAGVLALQGLRDKGRIQAGQKVLINGAGGGVGTFGIQIAKSHGAEVTGVDSAGKLDMLRSMGADDVIDYTREDFTKTGQRYDLILDVMGYHSILDYKRALNPNGTYVMVGGSMALVFQLMLFGPGISMTGNKKLGILMHKPNEKDLDAMTALFEAGTVVPVIDRRYPLSEVAEAVRYLGEGHTRGKLVITVGVGRS